MGNRRAEIEMQTILLQSPHYFTFKLYTEQCDDQSFNGIDKNQKGRRKEEKKIRERKEVQFGVESLHGFRRICKFRSKHQKLDMRNQHHPGIEEQYTKT